MQAAPKKGGAANNRGGATTHRSGFASGFYNKNNKGAANSGTAARERGAAGATTSAATAAQAAGPQKVELDGQLYKWVSDASQYTDAKGQTLTRSVAHGELVGHLRTALFNNRSITDKLSAPDRECARPRCCAC